MVGHLECLKHLNLQVSMIKVPLETIFFFEFTKPSVAEAQLQIIFRILNVDASLYLICLAQNHLVERCGATARSNFSFVKSV